MRTLPFTALLNDSLRGGSDRDGDIDRMYWRRLSPWESNNAKNFGIGWAFCLDIHFGHSLKWQFQPSARSRS